MESITIPKTVLVTGKNGQLGQYIQKLAVNYPQFAFAFCDRDQLNLSDNLSIASFFQENSFDIVINCAAYTAVDKAESEPELADQINHLAVKQLADIAKKNGMVLIHVSTDYVFNGQACKPYLEDDEVSPQGVYGLTKLKGEQAMQTINPKGFIIRTSWVYSEFGQNFVKTMLRLGIQRESLGVIFDQVGSPTYAGDLAKAILDIISKWHYNETAPEIYHFSNEGACSWYDFSKAIFEISQIDCDVKPIETKDYPTPATRPHYSLMNKAKIKQQFNLTIPYWRDSLIKCLNRLQANSSD